MYLCTQKRTIWQNITSLEKKAKTKRHTILPNEAITSDTGAEKDNQLIIVEVKTRRNEAYGHPEDAITNRKIRTLVSLADSYIKKFKLDLPVRFDVITVVGNEPPFRIEHIEEAFLPPIW